ncbi:4-hydroxythreonine-4-phosphate dehydrogenase PdxA [Chroococcidiopsis sp. CCNUC1]|jgi:4-hydroxythreonine-4-phosphate dehydrogenase|uniref:4-hydroxythreonine-4-phosphate dehydrogenase PdxA n=1 Tax=Chroococcidiopsis sp. CCNUC1 TaxID=2653189 RepID=UPI0020217B2A|nr:4-hydroxythreonine-4-phosphate dehydrogenase PdxA [Chroococcidiopsis sp. CCNUC1]URD52448.1 4-hydroxythreonine-4-phosphate dehydrogenase PdxA [Chroococcidiopsis sp. CCNUC1]
MDISTTTYKTSDRPRIAIAMGDPAGIGAEVILKALADRQLWAACQITVVGNKQVLLDTYDRLRQSPYCPLDSYIHPDELNILEVEAVRKMVGAVKQGTGNAASGAMSFAYLETAIARTLVGDFHGIVTAPIAKSAWKAAGYDYPGQTELLAEKAGVERFGMLFVARSPHTGWMLRALLATTHIPLHQVPEALTPQLLTRKLDLLVECLQRDFGVEQPRIAIAGLNPHSGEQGQLGREEVDWLNSWLEAERQNRPNLQLEGLLPPDTMWVKPGMAWYGKGLGSREQGAGETRRLGAEETRGKGAEEQLPITNYQLPITNYHPADAYLALYHDQGLIPVKLMAFDRAVNTSIGLPFIRTSPDHGTAFDIAGKGIADATSMKAAIQLATELVHTRNSATPTTNYQLPITN